MEEVKVCEFFKRTTPAPRLIVVIECPHAAKGNRVADMTLAEGSAILAGGLKFNREGSLAPCRPTTFSTKG
jgi:hypothetical protein